MTTEFAYIAVRDNGKWQILGAYTAENIGVAFDEAVSIYGEGNVQATYDSKGADKLNRTRMVGQMKAVGQKVTAGLGRVTEGYESYAEETREQRSRPLMRPTAKPIMEPPRPYQSGGMMPPSDYAKKEQQPPPERQHSPTMTKWGRSKRPINVFKDCKYTASYLSQQQRLTREYRRRRYRG